MVYCTSVFQHTHTLTELTVFLVQTTASLDQTVATRKLLRTLTNSTDADPVAAGKLFSV